jgi:hypothetical protein
MEARWVCNYFIDKITSKIILEEIVPVESESDKPSGSIVDERRSRR